jgi:nitroimidazol reductase NimA-like FMN-containing flavoprotein (pyridoxamine 5'-phosphate oxidase superfamily)
MAKDYLAQPLTAVRRKERAVDDEAWIVELLRRAPMAQLSTVHDGQPFINSNLFVYDASRHAVYIHTAGKGRTRSNVDADERVCLSVSEMGRLLPAPLAFNMSVEYGGVVIFGRGRAIEDPVEKEYGLMLLVRRYFPHLSPGDDYRTPNADELGLTSVYRIEIDEWSGKRKQAAAEYPGAFWFGDVGVAQSRGQTTGWRTANGKRQTAKPIYSTI